MTLQIDDLTVTFPARPGYLTVCRLNAALLGTSAGFDVEELDDLRLAVNEAATWLLDDPDAGGEVELRLSAVDGQVRIDGVRSGTMLPANPANELVEMILEATVDSHQLFENRSKRQVSLTKISNDDGS